MSKEQDRSLTDEEIQAFLPSGIDFPRNDKGEYDYTKPQYSRMGVKREHRDLCRAQDTKTREATCKEIFDEIAEKLVLEKNHVVPCVWDKLIIKRGDWQAFKLKFQGKLPQQGEKG